MSEYFILKSLLEDSRECNERLIETKNAVKGQMKIVLKELSKLFYSSPTHMRQFSETYETNKCASELSLHPFLLNHSKYEIELDLENNRFQLFDPYCDNFFHGHVTTIPTTTHYPLEILDVKGLSQKLMDKENKRKEAELYDRNMDLIIREIKNDKTLFNSVLNQITSGENK